MLRGPGNIIQVAAGDTVDATHVNQFACCIDDVHMQRRPGIVGAADLALGVENDRMRVRIAVAGEFVSLLGAYMALLAGSRGDNR